MPRLALVAFLVVALSTTGAARVPGGKISSLCIPLLMNCNTPTPAPQPTVDPSDEPSVEPTTAPTDDPSLTDLLPTPTIVPTIPIPGTDPTAAPTAEKDDPLVAVLNSSRTVFTQPSANLSGSRIAIGGVPLVSLVRVPLADGSKITVLKIQAQSITITDFRLSVRKHTGSAAITNARTMQLRGDVAVYLDSATATLSDGTTLHLGADTPPNKDDKLPENLLRVNLGLVGATADSITYDGLDQTVR